MIPDVLHITNIFNYFSPKLSSMWCCGLVRKVSFVTLMEIIHSTYQLYLNNCCRYMIIMMLWREGEELIIVCRFPKQWQYLVSYLCCRQNWKLTRFIWQLFSELQRRKSCPTYDARRCLTRCRYFQCSQFTCCILGSGYILACSRTYYIQQETVFY